ncbi:MAG: hypothetical protein V1853_05530 [bacterium]
MARKLKWRLGGRRGIRKFIRREKARLRKSISDPGQLEQALDLLKQRYYKK